MRGGAGLWKQKRVQMVQREKYRRGKLITSKEKNANFQLRDSL